MPLFDPYVIVGQTADGAEHLINVQTSEIGYLTMAIRTICYKFKSKFRKRYVNGIYLKQYKNA